LLDAQAYADDTPEPKQVLDPAVAVGAATAGATAGAALAAASGGILKPQITQGRHQKKDAAGLNFGSCTPKQHGWPVGLVLTDLVG
jgi:hypothetical protein